MTLESQSIFTQDFSKELANASDDQTTELVRKIWTKRPKLRADEAAMGKPFIRHLVDEISNTRHQNNEFATCTLSAIADTVKDIRTMQTRPLEEVMQHLKGGYMNFDDAAIQRSVEMCVRLWLTVNINSRVVAVGGTFHREIALDWAHSSSLKKMVEDVFANRATNNSSRMGTKVDGAFTADYFVNSCGMELVWTNYLTDHLRLDPDLRVLLIYRHKAFLSDQIHHGSNGPIPEDVSREALDTLNLLFPFGNLATKRLLATHGEQAFHDLGTCGRDRVFDLSEFKFWRKELEVLAEIYHSPPRTWRQLAFDRRHRLELSAFCITAMVALLTLISIPCTIIQAVYSVKAYRAAIAQNVNLPRSEL
jgi:hypothetical protein